MDAVSSRTLVLNKDWRPINVIPALKAIKKICAGRALWLDTKTFQVYSWEQWVNEWSDVSSASSRMSLETARTCLPEIIVCTEYKGVGFKTGVLGAPKFSRANLFLRDKGICQTCGQMYSSEELTMGHIIPRSKGGLVSWTNIVLQCIQCNQKMADKTPEQAGVRLIRKPFIPTAKDLRIAPEERIRQKMNNSTPKVWEQFLGKSVSEADKVASFMYWNAELKK